MKIAVAHLVDDASVGGVNRMLEHLVAHDGLTRHDIVRVERGALTPPKVRADVIISHLSACWANLAMLTALRGLHPDTPMAHVEHSYSERFLALNVDNRDRFHTLLGTVYALFDKVVAVSEPQARWLVRKGLVEARAMCVIRPAVDLAPFIEAGAARPAGRTIVGALGRFDRQKGFDILIEAFRELQDTDLVLHLYGDGPDRAMLEELAADLPTVAFKGFAENPAEAIAACDIIAMPSRWEPYGLVAIEAMAAGRPLICPRADGLEEHIAAGAIDVGGNSAAGWERALRRLREVGPGAPVSPAALAAGTDGFAAIWRDFIREMIAPAPRAVAA